MNSILTYLYKNENINGYIIRALLNDVRGFHYKLEVDSENNIKGLAAMWEEEKIVTLRGNLEFCKTWFKRFYREYNFYDLETTVGNYLLQNYKEDDEYSISSYLVLEYINNKRINSENPNLFSKIDKNEWIRIRDMYKSKYNINFTDFEENNMHWFVVYEKNYPISNICLEKVSNNFYILSNFYTAPDRQNKGIGTSLLKDVINDFRDTKFTLFVNSENRNALSIYTKLGFNISTELVNFEKQ